MKPAPADLDTPCMCSASRRPYELPHDAGCRWVPMSKDMDTGARQIDSAVERARAERAAIGPAPNGRGAWGARGTKP